MSRLYEALSRATVDQYQLGPVRPAVTAPKVVMPSRIPVETSSEPTKAAEVLSEVMPKPVEFEEANTEEAAKFEKVVELDEAHSVTVRASPAARLVALTNPKSLGAEKFRALVTRLDHLHKEDKLKSLQVSSSVVNEGKTMVAANLAVTLAKYSGAKTLLIEGDLHRPTLAPLFGLSELRGLAHWWTGGEQAVMDFLHRFNGMPLWFLAAGRACDQPYAILRSARLATAFAQLAGAFDWIVVDSMPMLPIIDANLWSRLVDGTLLVVREGMAPVKALKKGLQSLDHPKLIGVVVNEASRFDQGSYESNYYGSPTHRRKTTEESTKTQMSPTSTIRF